DITLDVRPADGGAPRTLRLRVRGGDVAPDGPDPLAEAGLGLVEPRPMLGELLPGGAAEEAGLRAGDLVEAIGGVEQPSVPAMVDIISAHPGQALPVRVRRDGAQVTLSV